MLGFLKLAKHAYSYTILYRSGKSNGNADSLSRLPLPESLVDVPTPSDVLLKLINLLSVLPILKLGL